jgi:hypothetical protein
MMDQDHMAGYRLLISNKHGSFVYVEDTITIVPHLRFFLTDILKTNIVYLEGARSSQDQ